MVSGKSRMLIALAVAVLSAQVVVEAASRGRCETVAEVAIANNFTILVQALQAANLVETLNKTDLYVTVFAPTDAAFASALASLNLTAEQLLNDTATLKAILQVHVVPHPLSLVTWDNIGTLNENDDEELIIRPVVEAANSANITTPGVRACRMSFVYPIDTVLLPKATAAALNFSGKK